MYSREDTPPKVEQTSNEKDRTLITISILRWLTNILKAVIKPARDIYLALGPEISVMQCLSDSNSTRQSVRNDFGNNLGPETPRVTTKIVDPYDPNGMADLSRSDGEIDASYSQNSVVDLQRSDDHILRRIPRFVDDVAALFTNENSMTCIVPYMKERIFRWLDG